VTFVSSFVAFCILSLVYASLSSFSISAAVGRSSGIIRKHFSITSCITFIAGFDIATNSGFKNSGMSPLYFFRYAIVFASSRLIRPSTLYCFHGSCPAIILNNMFPSACLKNAKKTQQIDVNEYTFRRLAAWYYQTVAISFRFNFARTININLW